MPSDASPDDPCLQCSRTPTAHVALRSQTGMVLAARYAVLRGPLCRECGTALFRERQNATLLKGWWGGLAFFTNLYAVAVNVVSWYRLTVLDAPRGTTEAAIPARGRPVTARPGVLVPLALFVAGSYLLGADTPPTDPTGACVNLRRGGMSIVDCGELHDGRVLRLVASQSSCPVGSDEAVKLRRPAPSLACVDLDR